MSLDELIEVSYNRQQSHSILNYMTHVEFERKDVS